MAAKFPMPTHQSMISANITSVHPRLRPALAGLLFAVLTLLYGFGLGIAFGGFEDHFQARIKASAMAVKDSVYQGDEARMKPVLDKAWVYMQRAHLHAGGLGASALGLIVIAAFVGAPALLLRLTAFGLGAGSFGYSLYWMWAGFRAPGLGGTGLAKESLKWLAMPSSGAIVLCTAMVLGLLVAACFRRSAAA